MRFITGGWSFIFGRMGWFAWYKGAGWWALIKRWHSPRAVSTPFLCFLLTLAFMPFFVFLVSLFTHTT